MVVIGIFHSAGAGDRVVRLVGEEGDAVYQEKIAEDETLVSMRASNPFQAQLIGRLLSRAGAEYVEIDAEAA
jgi:hypothetical protein